MILWDLARALGVSAYLSLSFATGAGAYATRPGGRRAQSRVVWQYVHRSAAVGGLLLLVAHVITLVLDSYAGVGWGAVVPFASSYRPLWVGLGTLAAYCLVTAAVTGLLRSRFAGRASVRLWRGIHLSGYAAWALAAVHFLTTGSDAGQTWALFCFAVGVSVVAAGLIARVAVGRPTIRSTAGVRPMNPNREQVPA